LTVHAISDVLSSSVALFESADYASDELTLRTIPARSSVTGAVQAAGRLTVVAVNPFRRPAASASIQPRGPTTTTAPNRSDIGPGSPFEFGVASASLRAASVTRVRSAHRRGCSRCPIASVRRTSEVEGRTCVHPAIVRHSIGDRIQNWIPTVPLQSFFRVSTIGGWIVRKENSQTCGFGSSVARASLPSYRCSLFFRLTALLSQRAE
jgi:hypothetical protein